MTRLARVFPRPQGDLGYLTWLLVALAVAFVFLVIAPLPLVLLAVAIVLLISWWKRR